jgi:hypothetical protein
MIVEVTTQADLERSARVISESFAIVAADLGLTPDNCPSHPAFTTADKVDPYPPVCTSPCRSSPEPDPSKKEQEFPREPIDSHL